jgi:hypothetical protein
MNFSWTWIATWIGPQSRHDLANKVADWCSGESTQRASDRPLNQKKRKKRDQMTRSVLCTRVQQQNTKEFYKNRSYPCK